MKFLLLAGALLVLGWRPAGASNLPSNAAFYTECLKAALQSQAIDRDGPYLRFACYGETAEWFYNALGRRDADVLREKDYSGDTIRFAEFTDTATGGTYCRRSTHSAQQYACSVSVRAGSFLDR